MMRNYVSFGHQRSKAAQDRVLLDTLRFETQEAASKAAETLREFGYWTNVHRKID